MTPEERKLEENLIKDNYTELKNQLSNLKNEIQTEVDETKKQEKDKKIKKLEEELKEIQTLIETLSSLEEQNLKSLKARLESLKSTEQEIRWEAVDLQNKKFPTPSTFNLLENSKTFQKLYEIIFSHPDEFINIKWSTQEWPLSVKEKLEYMCTKIHDSVVLFMKNKLWNSEKSIEVINNTIAPAFEWSLIEMLKDQWSETNTEMLNWIDELSQDNSDSWNNSSLRDYFSNLIEWVSTFAKNASWSYNKFSQWINAVDYLSVHNWVLRNPEKSEVLTNPLKFQEYMNDDRFYDENFSPYTTITDNIFKIDENQTFWFWISLQEKQNILNKIWNINITNDSKTTALIAKMIDKPEQFLKKTEWLQDTANSLLDWISSLNSVTNIFWVDILWEITKAPEERSWLYKIMDFVCKFVGITWWLEWIVKKRYLDRMNLTDEKNENISHIFEKYKELAWENTSLSITDENSCKSALSNFDVSDLDKDSSTKWDFLRDSIIENIDISLISPAIIEQAVKQHKLENSLDYYFKKETIEENWETKEITVIDEQKFTEDDKQQLAHNHLINMKSHLEKYNENELSDFYTNINSTEDIALCITASLYANENDIINWVKAKVFLPENYGSVRSDWTVAETWDNSWREKLDSAETSDKQVVSEQWIYDKAKEYWITDNRQISYILSTIKWECSFKNQEEVWKWNWQRYWVVDQSTWHAYYGRWFIPLKWKENYQKYTQIIKNSWKNFKDNDGNIIKWNDIDLVENPDIILKSNDLAIFITLHWMKNGEFTWKKLDDFINESKTDFYNARNIINLANSNPEDKDLIQGYADTAQNYLNKLWWEASDNTSHSQS